MASDSTNKRNRLPTQSSRPRSPHVARRRQLPHTRIHILTYSAAHLYCRFDSHDGWPPLVRRFYQYDSIVPKYGSWLFLWQAFVRPGWRIHASNIVTGESIDLGFIDADSENPALENVSLPDGDYEIAVACDLRSSFVGAEWYNDNSVVGESKICRQHYRNCYTYRGRYGNARQSSSENRCHPEHVERNRYARFCGEIRNRSTTRCCRTNGTPSSPPYHKYRWRLSDSFAGGRFLSNNTEPFFECTSIKDRALFSKH